MNIEAPVETTIGDSDETTIHLKTDDINKRDLIIK